MAAVTSAKMSFTAWQLSGWFARPSQQHHWAANENKQLSAAGCEMSLFLQAPAATDEAFMTDSDQEEAAADLEAEFEAEKNSRSLASLFGDGENVIEIDAEYQDEALKV